MSLLHEALKKAEREKGTTVGGEVFVDREEPPRFGPLRPIHLIVVGVLLALSAGGYFLMRGRENSRPLTVTVPTPLGIGQGPTVEELKTQSEEMLNLKEWAKAEEVLERLVILEPRNAELYNNLGVAQKRVGKREKAYEQYKKALALRPDFPEALNNLGVLYLADGKFAEAASLFQQVAQMKPDYAEAWFHLGMIEEVQGKSEAAVKDYERFLELSPGLDPVLGQQIRGRIVGLKS